MSASIIIIGGGIGGLTLGVKFLESGFATAIIRNQEVCASSAALGIVSSKGLRVARDPLFTILLAAQARYPQYLQELASQSQVPIQRSYTGVVEGFRDRVDYLALVARIYHGEPLGAFGVYRLDQGVLPGPLAARCQGALYYPRDFWFEPGDVLKALARLFVQRGGTLIAEDVFSLRQDKNLVTVACGAQSFAARAVVLAAGIKTIGLAETVVHQNLRHKVSRGIKLELAFAVPPPWASPRDEFYIKKGRLGMVWKGGRLRLGAFDLKEGDHSSPLMDETLAFCGLSQTPGACAQFAGSRLFFPQRKPWIGGLGPDFPYSPPFKPGIFVFSGFGKNGFLLAETCAQSLQKLVAFSQKDRLAAYLAPTIA